MERNARINSIINNKSYLFEFNLINLLVMLKINNNKKVFNGKLKLINNLK